MNYCVPAYFLVFLPVTALAYQLAPQRHRWKVLLGASYVFFWSISGKLLVYLLLSTCSIHHFGLWLDSLQRERESQGKAVPRPQRKAVKEEFNKRQRSVIAFAVALHIGLLLVLKYSPFFGRNLNSLLWHLHIPLALSVPKFLVPPGRNNAHIVLISPVCFTIK